MFRPEKWRKGTEGWGMRLDRPALALKQSKRKGDKAQGHVHGVPPNNPSGIQEEVERKRGNRL